MEENNNNKSLSFLIENYFLEITKKKGYIYINCNGMLLEI